MTLPPEMASGHAVGERRLRVLLVEDNLDDTRLLKTYLEEVDLPCRLVSAENLSEALSIVSDERLDLCLMDLELPDSEGVETVKRVRKRTVSLPIVVFTAVDDLEAATAALRAGAEEYLVKEEITPRTIGRTLRFVLERVEARRQREVARERWATVFEMSPVGLVISDADSGRFVEVNDAFVEMFGQSREEMLGSTSVELGHWDDPDRRAELVEQVKEEGRCRNEEAWYRDAEGRRGRMLLSCRRLALAEGDRLLWTVRDITERKKMEKARARLAEIVGSTPDYVATADPDGRVRWVNDPGKEMLGLDRGAPLEGTPIEKTHPSWAWELVRDEGVPRALEKGMWRGETALLTRDGDEIPVSQTIVAHRSEDGKLEYLSTIMRDVSEQKARQKELETTRDRLHGLLDTAAGIIFRIQLPDLGMEYITPNVEELVGYPVERWTEEPTFWMKHVPEEDLERIRRTISSVVASGSERMEVEFRLRHHDGSSHWYRAINRFEFDDGGEPVAFVGTAIDITERHELEEQLRHQALHDPLTGLANRHLLSDRIEQAAGQAQRRDEGIAVLMVDLKRFKRINESLGHTTGDRVLEEVARRLQEVVRAEDTVARWEGDEFCLLVTGLEERGDLGRIRDRLLNRIRQPISSTGRDFTLDVSVGAVLDGLPGDDALSVSADRTEDLIRYADQALREAKGREQEDFHLYRPELDDRTDRDPLAREQELRLALEAEQFEPFYQPIVNLGSGEVWGVEPLARWRDPERGLIGPGEFIGLAEETGLIHELGRQIAEQACKDLAGWKGPDPLRLTLNMSGRQFEDETLVERLAEWLNEASLAPEQTVVEVTETSIMRAVHRIEELREIGVHVFIDDFGTGYSSLLYLRDLEVDGLKVDMSFVQGLGQGRGNRAIVESTLTLGREMGLQVVAEGVETEDQLGRLQAMGCRLGQGYLFARPMPADEMGRSFQRGDIFQEE